MTGPLSNHLYKLDEINRRERDAQERHHRYMLLAILSLGIFCILVAIARTAGQ